MAVRSADRYRFSPSEVATHEVVIALVGCLFLPLYFIHLPGINLGPGDILIAIAGVSYLLRTGQYPISPGKLTLAGVMIFLFMSLLSVSWTPLPVAGLLDSFQLVLILVVVVPSLFLVFSTRRRRWMLFVALTTILSLLIVASTVEILVTAPNIKKYAFSGFGKQNTFHWTILIGTLLLGFLTLERSLLREVRVVAGGLSLLGAGIIVAGLTLSAIIGLAVGAWLLIHTAINRRSTRLPLVLFWALTLAAAALGATVIAFNWEIVYQEGALYSRIPMYREAALEGVSRFPLGHGIGSSPIALDGLPEHIPRSTHNFFLHYLIEIGVGAFGFLLILFAWARNVAYQQFRGAIATRPFEFAFTAVFLAYVAIAFFQPPPVRRVWWMFFAVSWAVVFSPG